MPPQPGNLRSQPRISDRFVATAAVNLIANHRSFQPSEMYADLMRASGLWLNVQQREALETLRHSEARNGRTAAGGHGHARPVARIASDRLIDLAALFFNYSMD